MLSSEIHESQYRIISSIGQGQYGRVFCAAHRQTKKLVALKEIDQQKISTRMFLQELSFLVTLQHANIVGCRGLEYTSIGRYLVLDYCEKGTLRNLLESQGRLELNLSLKLITDILLGLEHINNRNIIHRDLKPENVLLDSQAHGLTAKIADFGIARIGEETKYKQVGEGDTGSPAYMAPEQFYGHYSHASDIYAVGIILYELLMGERPFYGSFGDLQKAHLNQKIDIAANIPFLLRSILFKALQKLPQKRFSSASEMLKALKMATLVESFSDEENIFEN